MGTVINVECNLKIQIYIKVQINTLQFKQLNSKILQDMGVTNLDQEMITLTFDSPSFGLTKYLNRYIW